ncbi:MAG TPA: DUF1573 domain-containing protein [Aquaticitalea sp.]|nr:DUF1573 domain-containing protein [Aquaticitalea sp.]
MNLSLNKLNKVYASLLFFALISTFGFSQEKATTEKVGKFSFETQELDYGTIAQDADGVRVFKFTNSGNAPIVITGAKGSCGCTVPTYSKNVIQPGETGEIQVKYDTHRLGAFTKTVTLTSNASEPKKVLRIKGEVVNPEKG